MGFCFVIQNVSILGHLQVQARFGDEHRIHLESEGENLSMLELYIHLFEYPEHNADLEQWRRKNAILHSALHDKLLSANECSVCAGSRLRQDTRERRPDWSFKAVGALWDLTVSTIDEHGTGWQAWRHTPVVSVPRSLPPKLQMEVIPRDQVQELPGGVFKWGRYQTDPGTESLDAALLALTLRWNADRVRRIGILQEANEQQRQRPQKRPGDKLTLRQGSSKEDYVGRVWRSEEHWSFQEEATGIEVRVSVNPVHSARQRQQDTEVRLYRAVRAERVRR